jgi:hypothetical protein
LAKAPFTYEPVILLRAGIGVVVGPPPGADLGAGSPPRCRCTCRTDGEDGEVRVEVVEANADRLARLVADRPDVGVLAEAISPKELDGDPDELLRAVAQLELKELRGPMDSL